MWELRHELQSDGVRTGSQVPRWKARSLREEEDIRPRGRYDRQARQARSCSVFMFRSVQSSKPQAILTSRPIMRLSTCTQSTHVQALTHSHMHPLPHACSRRTLTLSAHGHTSSLPLSPLCHAAPLVAAARAVEAEASVRRRFPWCPCRSRLAWRHQR